MLSLNFDLIMLLILATMMLIGYVTGATVEFIKLLKIVIPFLIVFYFGGYISRLVFKSSLIYWLMNNISFLHGMPYFNTLIMFISTFIAFFGSYFIISLIIKFIQKRIQSEKVTYKLGRVNNIFGVFLAVARYYVIASILILPFFLLNITNKSDDFVTRIIMDNPPPFTRIGHLVNSSEPMINASNSLTNFLNLVDLNSLQNTYSLITDLPGTLDGYNTNIQTKLNAAGITIPDAGSYTYLTSFINNPDTYLSQVSDVTAKQNLLDLYNQYAPYKSLIDWVIQRNLTDDTRDQLISAFNTDYDSIYAATTDAKMKNDLDKAHFATQVYPIVNDWLTNTVHVDTSNLTNLLNDNNIYNIMEQLGKEYENKDPNGLINQLRAIHDASLHKKLDSINKFVSNYESTYKPIIEKMNVDMPYKYKLLASTMTNINFEEYLNRSPLMAMYVIDTIDFLNSSDVQLIPNETFDQSLIKIIIPVYILKPAADGTVPAFTASDMQKFLDSLNTDVNNVILTNSFIMNMLYAFTTAQYDFPDGSQELYIQYLVDNGNLSVGAVKTLANYDLLKTTDDARAAQIESVLNQVGDQNG